MPVDIEGAHGRVTITRPGRGVIVVTYSGHDVGEFRDVPFRELDRCVAEEGPVHLFVDGRASNGATVEVSSEWARWLGANRERLASVHLLSGSKVIQMNANFVKRISAVGEKMRIYTDASPFDADLAAALLG